jgi:transglutaminase-like putative cysteine protease
MRRSSSEGKRVAGTCRHFAVLSCALLRHRGIAAHVRCGFATYFQPGQGLDHWITEYRDDSGTRWIRVDSEISTLPGSASTDHEDLRVPENLIR